MIPPKQFTLKIDPKDGTFWVVMIKPGKPMRKITNVTDEVMLGLVADLIEETGVRAIERDVTFADGKRFRVTIEDTDMVPLEQPQAA